MLGIKGHLAKSRKKVLVRKKNLRTGHTAFLLHRCYSGYYNLWIKEIGYQNENDLHPVSIASRLSMTIW
jgi:hypothetical protein